MTGRRVARHQVRSPSGRSRELSASAASGAYDRMLSDVRDTSSRLHALGKEFGFDDKSWHNGDGDAFRHAAASALMTCGHGVAVAVAFGVGYEVHNFIDWVRSVSESDQSMRSVVDSYFDLVRESAMDVHNDIQGIQPGLCREQLSEREIASRIAEQTKEGRMLMLKEGKLSRSARDKPDNSDRRSPDRTDVNAPRDPPRSRDSRDPAGRASPADRENRRDRGPTSLDRKGPGEMIA